jgi:lysophospholipase L1-like esterase
MRLFRAIPLLLLLLAGCGGDIFTLATPSLIVTNTPDPTLTFLHTFGDSITAGYTLTDFNQDYVALISTYNKLPYSNYGNGGDQACDVSRRQIFGHGDSPTLAHKGLYTVLIGTNDVAFKGPGAPEAVFNLCDLAAISWLAVPLEFKVLGTASSVRTSGPTRVDQSNNWNAAVTDGQGASITFPFQATAPGAVYVWYRIIDGNPGTFTYSLDGNVLGSRTTATTPALHTLNGEADSLALLRLEAVPAGTHTITLTQTSAGTAGLGVVAVGTPPTGNPAEWSKVLVGTVPLQLNDGNRQVRAFYTADIMANVALLAHDGLPVTLFDPPHYMTGTAADMNDALHPNALGNEEIFKAIESSLP